VTIHKFVSFVCSTFQDRDAEVCPFSLYSFGHGHNLFVFQLNREHQIMHPNTFPFSISCEMEKIKKFFNAKPNNAVLLLLSFHSQKQDTFSPASVSGQVQPLLRGKSVDAGVEHTLLREARRVGKDCYRCRTTRA